MLDKKFLKIVVPIIMFFIIVISIVVTTLGIQNAKNKKVKYSYNINNDIEYRVELYKNSYIEAEEQKENESYIAELIKNIKTKFKFTFNSSKSGDLSYTYSVKAYVNGDYSVNDKRENVLKKEYVIVPSKTITNTNPASIIVNEIIDIDYNFYNDVVSKFRQEYKLPLSSFLEVKFDIDINGVIDGEKMIEHKVLTLKIPLNTQVFKIEKEVQEDVKNVIYENSGKKNASYIICSLLLIFIDIIIGIVAYLKLYKKKESNYSYKLKKILREYGDIIIEIENQIDELGYDVINVKNFNEILDLEEELRTPINFYEKEKGERGEFTLLNNNIIYKYVLNNDSKKL